MIDFLIRRARPSDAPVLARIGHDAWQRGIATDLPDTTKERASPEAFASFVADQSNNILVAETRTEVLGFVATADGENRISDLWVTRPNEGKGIGSHLLAEIEADLKRKGFDAARIEVMTSNTRAIGLSRYRGYHETARGMRMDRVLALPLHKTELSKRLLSD
ncbi:N-acetyltransferase [Cognatishimia sp. SS12]|uniref:GNAT family N-acetyltransferase n=1 Tax=Cognatishimia sp. SS12 TaxID=2979465 RepID=UPI00232EB92A|nr:N-acetyltransferase [Cognatishimia sp. SS12]MDC0736790.1 N-acetyltransferase [Cognatishimia sp. SS12]